MDDYRMTNEGRGENAATSNASSDNDNWQLITGN